MIIKCKMCGGDLSFEEGSTVCECEYCGSKQTLPNVDNEKKGNLFNRANRLRMNSEFDKASAVYESIVAEFPEEAEAYWGLCLCAYGIEYVDDPATGKKMPTCHRTMTTSIMEDENFEQACDNADSIARKVYRDEAKAIDRIQRDILAIAANEAPYDVFICYKETDENGERTEDSVLAQDIYDALTAKGLKVFFSRITLEDKLGVQYEPYIYAALSSAKVMIAVGTQFEYYDAVWVKNEWSRFLSMMKADKAKTLIPCFKDLDAYDMPKDFKGLQAQDMGKIGWLQDLTRGVEKLCGKIETTTVHHTVVNASPQTGLVDNLMKRVRLFLEDEEYDQASEYINKVLDVNAEHAPAYVAKVLVKFRMKAESELIKLRKSIDTDVDWTKALRFADSEQKKIYQQYADQIRQNIALDERRFKAQPEEKKLKKDIESYSKNLVDQMEVTEKIKKRCDYLPQFIDTKKRELEELNNKLNTLSGLFAVAKRKQLGEQIKTTTSELNVLTAEFSKSHETINRANELVTSAREHLIAAKQNYKDFMMSFMVPAASIDEDIKIIIDNAAAQSKCRVGKVIEFGHYAGKPIEWQVLAVNKCDVLMISLKGLDAVCFNVHESDGNNWKSSYIHSWLNKTFYSEAFSTEEQNQLLSDESGDKISLLSLSEAKRYFNNDYSRICYATEKAIQKGVFTDDNLACCWWLRSPGDADGCALRVNNEGKILDFGYVVYDVSNAIRPVIRLRLPEIDLSL